MINFLYKILDWFRYNFPIYIGSLNFEKPWKYYKMAFPYFVKPKYKLYKSKISESGETVYTWYRNKKWFAFDIFPLYWKLKYNEPRFEYNPAISLVIGNRQYIWQLEYPNNSDDSDFYWEAMLYFLYCDKEDIKTTYENYVCETSSGRKITIEPYLTEYAKYELAKNNLNYFKTKISHM